MQKHFILKLLTRSASMVLATPTAAGFADLVNMSQKLRLVFFMAWSDIRARYRRSVLGPLWMTIGTAVGVVGLGFIWSELFKMDRATFIPLLTVGLVLWQFISSCVTEASSVFVRQGNIIRNLDLPLSIHPAQLILRHLINLAHNIPLFFLVVLILGHSLSPVMLLAIPAIFMVAINLFWVVLLIGIFAARFRDLEYLINMVMPLVMFLSPVMYRPSALALSGKIIMFNPLTYFIEIVRMPLLGEVPSLKLVAINLALFVVGGCFTLWMFNKKRNRIALWV